MDSSDKQAVRSLRSRFERLAAETSIHVGHSPRSSIGNGKPLRPAGDSPSPRRTSSNSQLNSAVLDTGTDTGHLRTSSSSSDLKVLVKRAPPPPPPLRSAKAGVPVSVPSPSSSPAPSISLSPALSPALRPVPIPPLKLELKDSDVPPSVSALRSKLYVLFRPSFWTAAEERNLPYQCQTSKSTTTSS